MLTIYVKFDLKGSDLTGGFVTEANKSRGVAAGVTGASRGTVSSFRAFYQENGEATRMKPWGKQWTASGSELRSAGRGNIISGFSLAVRGQGSGYNASTKGHADEFDTLPPVNIGL